MKKLVPFLLLAVLLAGCSAQTEASEVLAVTKPVYDLTRELCGQTGIRVSLLITQNVSCLHDYTLQVGQMRAVESCSLLILSGGGMEEGFEDILSSAREVCDASAGIAQLHGSHGHEGHHHEDDPHIWLAPGNMKRMAENICQALRERFPEHAQALEQNLASLTKRLDDLQFYGETALSTLSCRELVTFHDGFSYVAEAFDLTILESMEEESGSEASGKELIRLALLIREHRLPAIFTESYGSSSAATILSAETGAKVYALDMGMGERDYFSAMYYNIDTVKEALS